MLDYQILGCSIYDIIWWFWIYSFLGWCFECIYVAIHERRIINRGFVLGPICTIYGVGAVSIIILLRPIEHNIFLLIVFSIIVTSGLEYIVYILLDKLFHQKWWDYSDLRFHYKGILSLESSIAWAILALLLVKIIHPIMEGVLSLINRTLGTKLLIIITVLYIVDFSISCIKAAKRSESSKMVILRVKTETLRHIIMGFIRKK